MISQMPPGMQQHKVSHTFNSGRPFMCCVPIFVRVLSPFCATMEVQQNLLRAARTEGTSTLRGDQGYPRITKVPIGVAKCLLRALGSLPCVPTGIVDPYLSYLNQPVFDKRFIYTAMLNQGCP